MDNITINIIPLGTSSAADMYNCFIDNWKSLCSQRSWCNHKIRFVLHYSDTGIIQISGGKVKLKERTITIKSDPIDMGKRDDKTYRKEWSDKYQMIILLCNTKELMKQYNLQLLVAQYRSIDEIGCDNVYLFFTDIDDVVAIPDMSDYTAAYIGACKAVFGGDFNKTLLKKNYNKLSQYSVGQAYTYFKIFNKEISFPENVICSLSKYQWSGYVEIFIITINKILKPKFELQINDALQTLKIYKKNMSILPSTTKRIRLALIGVPASGKSYTLEDIIGSVETRLKFESLPVPQEMLRFRHTIVDVLSSVKSKDGIKANKAIDKDKPCIGCFKNGNETFLLEILDIPGESFTEERIRAFKNAFNYLLDNLNTKIAYKDNKDNKQIKLSDALDGCFDKYDIHAVIEGINNLNLLPEGFSDPTVFKEFMKEYFVYFYYFMVSSDIVVCHNIGSDEQEDSRERFRTFTDFFTHVHDIIIYRNRLLDADQNWFTKQIRKLFSQNKNEIHRYLNIRGVDILMNKDVFQMYEYAADRYSLFSLSMFNKIYYVDDVHEDDGEQNLIAQLKDEDDFDDNGMGDCFKKGVKPLINEVKKVVDFVEGKSFVKESSGGQVKVPRHTYFTASPIAKKFESIDSFKNKVIDGDTADVNAREFFGTLYLVCDILFSNKITLQKVKLTSTLRYSMDNYNN